MFNSNPDFFPTPKELQRKMLNKIDWKMVRTCLEPSGGKGDLVEGIMQQYEYTGRYRNNSKHDIDVIEIDPNLVHILKSKGFRVIGDNFLSFNTYKRYDVIAANFPFSEGDKHLMKSLELIEQQKGGQLVCLINGETLKNPYSNIRKELIRKLDEFNAEVEFIQDAFSNSERSTGVEVALIYLNVPRITNNSTILEELKQDELYKNTNDHNNNYLIDSDFIKGIVEQYNYEVKAGLKLIEEYNNIKPFMLRSFQENSNPVLKLELEYKDDEGSSLENAYIKQIRLKYWTALFSNEQFMGLFTSNLRRKYMEYVQELKDYDFSFYNIYTIRIQISKEMVQGVEDTILDLFEEFSHKHHYYDEQSKNVHMYNGWKTNKAYKINKKVIIPLNAFNGWSSKPYNPTSYQILDKLKDIEKVFNYLDSGLTEDLDITEALKMAEHYQETKKIELKFFTITFYKKGTMHLEFKNMELLQKFNLFGSQRKNFLPPSYGKARYSEMTPEEKDTINEFEGEQSYNKVMSNKSYYITDTSELLKLTS